MKPRPVEIVIYLKTSATLKELRRCYYASICDRLTQAGEYSRISRVEVFNIKHLKSGTPRRSVA